MSERAEQIVTLVLGLICLVICGAALLPRLTTRTVPITISEPEMTIAVEGEVVNPGLYTVPFRTHAAQAIELAGGFTLDAQRSLVNLAQVLGPGDRLFVPSRYSPEGSERINLNTATLEELQKLSGVGPSIAQRIVAGRPYTSLEDLLRVSGIGEKTLERLRGSLTL